MSVYSWGSATDTIFYIMCGLALWCLVSVLAAFAICALIKRAKQ